MLSGLFSLIKWTAFAAIILVLGQVVEWRNRTISDHIKTTLSHFDTQNRISQATERASKRVEQFSKEERARLDKLLSGRAPN